MKNKRWNQMLMCFNNYSKIISEYTQNLNKNGESLFSKYLHFYIFIGR